MTGLMANHGESLQWFVYTDGEVTIVQQIDVELETAVN